MGLDVTAYEIVELVKADPTEEEREAMGEEDDIHALYPVAPFEKHSDGLPDGLYRISGKALSAFHRSYSGYNRWREGLAALIGTTPEDLWKADPPSGPFLELIHNSDCEGLIGPRTSAKLAKDFAEWMPRAAAHLPADPLWFEGYKEWAEMFALAAGRGAVKLH